jgi:hypothetical protein
LEDLVIWGISMSENWGLKWILRKRRSEFDVGLCVYFLVAESLLFSLCFIFNLFWCCRMLLGMGMNLRKMNVVVVLVDNVVVFYVVIFCGVR